MVARSAVASEPLPISTTAAASRSVATERNAIGRSSKSSGTGVGQHQPAQQKFDVVARFEALHQAQAAAQAEFVPHRIRRDGPPCAGRIWCTYSISPPNNRSPVDAGSNGCAPRRPSAPRRRGRRPARPCSCPRSRRPEFDVPRTIRARPRARSRARPLRRAPAPRVGGPRAVARGPACRVPGSGSHAAPGPGGGAEGCGNELGSACQMEVPEAVRAHTGVGPHPGSPCCVLT